MPVPNRAAPQADNNDLDTYVVWTNKGGVGKTTMTFQIAMEFARQNPDRRVLLIDMCPQANLSATALTHVVVQTGNNRMRAANNADAGRSSWLHRGEGIVNRLMGTAYQPAAKLGVNAGSVCMS
jgi:nitrogenase subunit NifH